MSSAGAGPSSSRVDLVAALTAAAPGFALWKHAEAVLGGHGDIDAALPGRECDAAVAAFRAWAARAGYSAVVVCDHVPATTVAAAADAEGRLEQLDLVHAFVLHAAALVEAERLGPLTATGPDGARRLRPGAEGLLRLIREEGRSAGRAPAADPSEVRELLRRDAVGVEATAALLGTAARPVSRLARAVADGDWDRRAALTLELAVAVRAVRRPGLATACLRFDLRGRRCLLLDALRAGRRLRGPTDTWLGYVRQTHRVLPIESA